MIFNLSPSSTDNVKKRSRSHLSSVDGLTINCCGPFRPLPLSSPHTHYSPSQLPSSLYRVTTADAGLFSLSSQSCPSIGQFLFFDILPSPSCRFPWTLAAAYLDTPALSARTTILHFSIVDCQRAETSCFIVLDNCYHITAHRRRKVRSRPLPRSCTRHTTTHPRRLSASSAITRTVPRSDRSASDNACRLAPWNRG